MIIKFVKMHFLLLSPSSKFYVTFDDFFMIKFNKNIQKKIIKNKIELHYTILFHEAFTSVFAAKKFEF